MNPSFILYAVAAQADDNDDTTNKLRTECPTTAGTDIVTCQAQSVDCYPSGGSNCQLVPHMPINCTEIISEVYDNETCQEFGSFFNLNCTSNEDSNGEGDRCLDVSYCRQVRYPSTVIDGAARKAFCEARGCRHTPLETFGHTRCYDFTSPHDIKMADQIPMLRANQLCNRNTAYDHQFFAVAKAAETSLPLHAHKACQEVTETDKPNWNVKTCSGLALSGADTCFDQGNLGTSSGLVCKAYDVEAELAEGETEDKTDCSTASCGDITAADIGLENSSEAFARAEVSCIAEMCSKVVAVRCWACDSLIG